ncbi:MAG: MBL fold metallo-hydrolase [Deferribacteres bacterium]|nr:MBL fold metallo-hydrolase [Deferribacteres bacterium]
MIIKRLVVGPLDTNAYLIGDEATRQAVVVDPGDEPERILDLIKDSGMEVNAIICTHAHFDHIGAAGDIKNATGARILLHRDDLENYELVRDQAAIWGYDIDELPPPDGFIEEGNNIQVGNLSFRVMHTPGHSPGGICLYGEGIIITGDTIFKGSVGRTDFPGGSVERLRESFKRIIALPDETAILSGHGPETTVGTEKRENFFVREL